ncbi:MAG: GMP synthase [Nitrospirae bacterium]|nr:GMP synthase [Nitrospirota bacterium]
MPVLIVKNIPMEGPGTIEDFLREKGIPYTIAELSKGEQVADTADYSHLVVMGGPMAVYEMDRYPYLGYEADLIGRFINEKKAVLGVCLGAQMVAHCLGARVYAGDVKEIGWYEVDITPEGMADEVFSSIAVDGRPVAEVFQWHGDTFDLPEGAVRIASSSAYPNQAFRYGSRIYALQFHIEVTPAILKEWFEGEEGVDVEDMLAHTEKIYPEYYKRAMKFYDKFFS